jgi:uncharacterized membrane protein YhaH (DUF805 family)
MIATKPEAQFNLIDWWKKVVRDNYANFDGRARRAEYWNFVLANFLITLSMYFLMFIFALSVILSFMSIVMIVVLLVYNIAVLLPNLAVMVRRLHDTNKSGWLLLLGLIPLLGGIILLVFFVEEGNRGTNQYGSDPKIAPDFINEIGIKEYLNK